MARSNPKVAARAAPAPEPADFRTGTEAPPSYQDDMVEVRAVSGVLIDPYTLIRFETTPQRAFVTSWMQAQIDAKKLEIVQG